EHPPGPEVHDYVVRRVADYSHYPVIERRGVQQETLMSMVGMGFGISLVSEGWVALGIPGVVMRPLAEDADIVPFSAIWSPNNDNPVLRRFISAAHVMAGRARPGTSDWAGIGTLASRD
ncbi:MAG: LysR substrate-binding domain-containing protein, partial [Sphingomonadaceae bacterium]